LNPICPEYPHLETSAKPYNSCHSKKRMGFSEVTGGRALSFRNLSMGEAAAPSIARRMRRGKVYPPQAELPHKIKLLEKTRPRALELKKSPSSLRKYELFKGLRLWHGYSL